MDKLYNRPYLYAVDFTLGAAETQKVIDFVPDSGNILGAFIETNFTRIVDTIVPTELKTRSGKVIQNAVTMQAFKQRQSGDYMSSMMPILYKADGGGMQLRISVPAALGTDLNGQLILAYDPNTVANTLAPVINY